MKKALVAWICAAFFCVSGAARASLITVWDTFDGTPVAAGMAIGQAGAGGPNLRQGIRFTPSATGYFEGFTFGAYQSGGVADWLFTLRADAAALPGAVLETLPLLDVTATAAAPGVYTVTASSTLQILAANAYWLMAELPNGSAGSWSRIESGTGTRAFCDLNAGCSSYIALTDNFAGAVEIRVQTDPAGVPGPAVALLLGLGFAVMAVTRRRRTR